MSGKDGARDGERYCYLGESRCRPICRLQKHNLHEAEERQRGMERREGTCVCGGLRVSL